MTSRDGDVVVNVSHRPCNVPTRHRCVSTLFYSLSGLLILTWYPVVTSCVASLAFHGSTVTMDPFWLSDFVSENGHIQVILWYDGARLPPSSVLPCCCRWHGLHCPLHKIEQNRSEVTRFLQASVGGTLADRRCA
ncbi:hypothetical protein M404DRAFT_337098 [Pisolithus tinctorius Marx 270]|uniref:Uncharacterized protein n=1 Tax=Pisolithus tinctorius Marx 270 TaxID=870435 RepID=A0A0C3JBA0_PISTI|nr:hypothetical protein M404DRAFT_337098 [Pisolithus tinctorius Marx 270]